MKLAIVVVIVTNKFTFTQIFITKKNYILHQFLPILTICLFLVFKEPDFRYFLASSLKDFFGNYLIDPINAIVMPHAFKTVNLVFKQTKIVGNKIPANLTLITVFMVLGYIQYLILLNFQVFFQCLEFFAKKSIDEICQCAHKLFISNLN